MGPSIPITYTGHRRKHFHITLSNDSWSDDRQCIDISTLSFINMLKIQLYLTTSTPINSSLDRLVECSTVLQKWFEINDLQLNPDQSDAAFFGTIPSLEIAGLPSSVIVASCSVIVSNRLKTLGITHDSALTFENHVNDVVKACNYHKCALRHFQQSLTHDVAKTLACSIVGYRINYCNALLFGSYR